MENDNEDTEETEVKNKLDIDDDLFDLQFKFKNLNEMDEF